jgi:hypothetical protein
MTAITRRVHSTAGGRIEGGFRMTDSTLTAPPLAAAAAPAGPANVEELVRYVPGFLRGARWFWWIAGLSAVNVACDLGHAGINFVLGLAFTQLAHVAFASNIAIALAIDALFIGGFYLVGQQAQKGRTWAFVLGGLLYLCDGLLYLEFEIWMSVAFHAFALFQIGKAFMSLQAAKKATGLR